MIDAERIAETLGGEKTLRQPVRSLGDLSAVVEHGLPKATLRVVARRLFDKPSDVTAFMHQVVPPATYKRRRQALSLLESERTERLARVIATAEYVWDDVVEARRFLLTPHPLLDNRSPLQVALTELGARRVEEELWKIFYGVPV